MASEMMKWPYLPMINIFKDEMNKLLCDFDKPGNTSVTGLKPPLDVSETEEDIYIKVEIPGVNTDEINISVQDNVLKITGEKNVENKEKGANYHFIERRSGSFERSISLPSNVKFKQATAEYKKGILEIRLPKQKKQEAKKISVKMK